MKDKAGEEKYIGLFGIIGLIVFHLSFIPYLLLAWVAAAGTDTFFGGDMFNHYEYGFKAVAYMWMIMSVMVPVMPFCLLYQIVFGAVYIRKRPIEIKKPAFIYAGIFAALVLTPCLFYTGREVIYTQSSVPKIRTFLSEKYGEDVSKECKIKLDDIYYEEFEVYSPVMPEGKAFTVSRDSNGSFDDHGNLITGFENTNEGFRGDLNRYVDDKYDLPENMHSEARCTNIRFGDFKYGDDYSPLITTAEYTIDRLYVDVEEADQKSLENLLISIWKEECPKFMDSLGDSLVIIVSKDGQAIANLQITMPIPANNNQPVGSVGVLDAGFAIYGLKNDAFYI